MAAATDIRGLKRKIAQIRRRPHGDDKQLVRHIAHALGDFLKALRHRASDDPDHGINTLLELHEHAARLFEDLDDPYAHLSEGLDAGTRELVDLVCEARNDSRSSINRYLIFERVFHLWEDDESGLLSGLGDALLDMAIDPQDEDGLMEICRLYLRDAPLVFPTPKGKKLDLERSLLEIDRYRVERVIGEVLARRGQVEYAVHVARSHWNYTDDAVDYVRCLLRANLRSEAIEVARRALHRPQTPRRPALQTLYEELLTEAPPSLKGERAQQSFLEAPSAEAFRALKADCPPINWRRTAESLLGELERSRRWPGLVFRLYLEEGMITEADGVVVTQPVDPQVLAAGAERMMATRPDRAAGWLLIASHALMREARLENYRQAAVWLDRVRQASEETGQGDSFVRALDAFRDRYRGRPRLMRILDEFGL